MVVALVSARRSEFQPEGADIYVEKVRDAKSSPDVFAKNNTVAVNARRFIVNSDKLRRKM